MMALRLFEYLCYQYNAKCIQYNIRSNFDIYISPLQTEIQSSWYSILLVLLLSLFFIIFFSFVIGVLLSDKDNVYLEKLFSFFFLFLPHSYKHTHTHKCISSLFLFFVLKKCARKEQYFFIS